MKFKDIFNRTDILRALLLIGSVAIMMLVAPRTDIQSFSYELNQPWKYPLLTAEYDTPIMRDSASAHAMRDSIDAAFIPFVHRDSNIGQQMATRFSKHVAGTTAHSDIARLTQLIQETYSRGIVDNQLYGRLSHMTPPRVRISDSDNDISVVTVDASGMLSQAMAFRRIDSLYTATAPEAARITPDIADAISASLIPNVTLDSVTDAKFRSQEYLEVAGALGVIKKGQRIIDRGEIITPQLFTNLNTYQEVLKRHSGDEDSKILFLIGQSVYMLLIMGALMIFLAIYRPAIFGNLRQLTFIICFVTLFYVFAAEMFEYVTNGLIMVPFAVVPIIIMVFTDTRTAIFSLWTAIMLVVTMVSTPIQFAFSELIAGLAGTYSLHQLTRRSQLLRTALITFISYLICYVVSTLMMEGSFAPLTWKIVSLYAINAVVLSFAYILILVIEKTFGFTSLVSLVELSDINNPLLRRMAEVAPGTFQHSIQVSTLAAEAARAIGADTQLVRTGALYHDIGKTESPVFFTENQHGVNPHAGLDPETSAHKIISHVTDGLALAAKEKLPAVVRAFISEHHGRGLTKYFYNTAVNNAPEGTEVDPEKFRYPGPDPQSRETGILMLADCVEAASRSLKEYSTASIDALVDKIVDSIVAEGRLRESPLSMRDIETIKKSFKKRLATIYHSRVAYPEAKKTSNQTPVGSNEEQDVKKG